MSCLHWRMHICLQCRPHCYRYGLCPERSHSGFGRQVGNIEKIGWSVDMLARADGGYCKDGGGP